MSELSVPLRPGRLKRGHPCPSSLHPPPHCLFLFLSLSSSSFTSRRQPERRPGWRADAQGLSLRLGPPCQLGAFSPPPPPSLLQSRARDLSLPSLPPTVVLVPRPAKTLQSRLPSFSPTRDNSYAVTQNRRPAERKSAGGPSWREPSSFGPNLSFFWGRVMIFVLY